MWLTVIQLTLYILHHRMTPPLSHRNQVVCLAIAAMTSAAFGSTSPRQSAPSTSAAEAQTVLPPAPATPDPQATLAQSLCDLKRKIGARRGAWAPARCREVAAAVLSSAARHDLSPALLLAVMIQESDLDETAARVSHPHGGLAKDSGLMGIRCVLGKGGRCTNALVRGMPWRQVMDPATNVELGARYLAHYRDAPMRCRHRDHAYWAHYNHGTRYISRGDARFYPRRVAALYSVLSEKLGLETPAVSREKTMAALGRRSIELSAAIRTTPTAPLSAANPTT
jgi:hypothetical protein